MTIRVNGEQIPEEAIRYELDRLVKFYSEYMSSEEMLKQIDALKIRAKEQAIGAKLLISETARLDIKVPADDVDKRFEAMVKKAGGKDVFERIMKERGITTESVRKSIEQGRRVDLLVERITQVVSDPTESEMIEHFKKHADEYKKPERVQARHILIRFDPDKKADKQTSLSRIKEIRQKIKEGADFADQAAAYSDCPSGKKTGGSLGWISRGMTIPEFDNVVFSMKVGELSEVFETPLGFHVIHKIDHDEASEAEFDEVREKIREFLRHSYRGEALTAYVNELKEKAVIEEN
ncbi:MAG: peptidylprolyl isomerase [Kiritimatiellae bacterium]|nr:peptidylprolyl isomerase [Kiritimatiellia bacterium]MDD5520744.1 peptidylprolyl isomerase [Kiritimatiellia bacterium]